jgi:hypothetical protein
LSSDRVSGGLVRRDENLGEEKPCRNGEAGGGPSGVGARRPPCPQATSYISRPLVCDVAGLWCCCFLMYQSLSTAPSCLFDRRSCLKRPSARACSTGGGVPGLWSAASVDCTLVPGSTGVRACGGGPLGRSSRLFRPRLTPVVAESKPPPGRSSPCDSSGDRTLVPVRPALVPVEGDLLGEAQGFLGQGSHRWWPSLNRPLGGHLPAIPPATECSCLFDWHLCL